MQGCLHGREDEGSCLPPKYRCCCLKPVFSLVFKYKFTERVFLNNLLDACEKKKKYIYIYIYIAASNCACSLAR